MPGAPDAGSPKFSCHAIELDDLRQSRAVFADVIGPWPQTLEAAVMDTADDIAWTIHGLEDFHRVGVLQQAVVGAELNGWLRAPGRAGGRNHGPGADLERLRRRMADQDAWVYDDDAFTAAVERVREDLVDGLLAWPFDGSMAAERAVAEFSARRTSRLVGGVDVRPDPPVRSGHVALVTAQWHEVAVLKFVHQRSVLLRADLAPHQRAQATVLTGLVGALHDWLTDDDPGGPRLPPRLHDLVELPAVGMRPSLPRGRSTGRPAAARWWTMWLRSPTARPQPCSTCSPAGRAGCGPTERFCSGTFSPACPWPARRRPRGRSRR